jgi:3-oxoadipate enol-lactonase
MHYRTDGDGPAVVFANSLGTDLRLWDAVLPLLPGIRAIRFDKRGHGLSSLGPNHLPETDLPKTGIDAYAEDAAALIEAVADGPVVFVGLSVGGMIGQALASRRPDLVRALVLSNTAAKMGTPDAWQARIATVRDHGIEPIGDGIMERWFAPAFRARPDLALWRNMLVRTDAQGYSAACAAIAAADLTARTATLALPVLAIAGEQDGASPPDTVQATAKLIAGARFHVIPDAGHLPCIETPAAWAALVAPFLTEHAR